MSYTLQNPLAYFPLPTKSSAAGLCKLYVGLIDTDPLTPANQVQVYAVQPDGSELAVPQPIQLSAGGVPQYNGSPVQLKITADVVSVKVTTSIGALVSYTPRWAAEVSAPALAAVDSGVLVGGVAAEVIAKSAIKFNPAAYGMAETNTGQQNTAALNAMSAAITAYLTSNPSGKVYVEFPEGAFTIGDQTETPTRWLPVKNLSVQSFPSSSIHVHFRQTKLKWRDGLRFGLVGGKESDIGYMLQFFRIGNVTVTGAWELDGNDAGQIVGSTAARDYADYGMEILEGTTISIKGFGYHHNFLLDGIISGTKYTSDSSTEIDGLISIRNGRQSHSIVGGDNIKISNFVYGLTGYGPVNTSPAAGAWIESESDHIGSVTFTNGYIGKCRGGSLGSVNGIGYQVKGAIKALECEIENSSFSPLMTQNRDFTVDDCIIRGCVDYFGDPAAGIVLSDSIRPTIRNSTFYDTMKDGSPAYKLSGDPAAGGGILSGLFSRFDIVNCKAFAAISTTHYVTFNLVSCNVDGLDLYVTGEASPINNLPVFRVINGYNFSNFVLWNRLSGAQAGDAVGFIDIQNISRHENNRIDISSGAFADSIIWGAGLVSSGGRAGPLFDKDNFNRRAKQFLALHKTGTNMSTGFVGAHRILSYGSVPSDGSSFLRGDLILNNTTSASGVPAWSCTVAGVAGSTAVFKPFSNLGA